MPHCQIEYSSDLEQEVKIPEILLMITNAMVDTGLFNIKNIKVKAMPVSSYLIGGERVPYIHSSIQIKAGRTDDQKQLLGQAIIDTLAKEFLSVDKISVEVIDMNSNFYSRKL